MALALAACALAPAAISAAPAQAARATQAAERVQADGAAHPIARTPPSGCETEARGTIRNGPRGRPRVSVTFDESLGVWTKPILDILAEHRARATFFQVGREIKARPGLARLIVQRGHELANHTFTHADLAELSRKEIRAQILRTQRAARRHARFTPCLFRPPMGSVDRQAERTVDHLGMPLIFWDSAAVEWLYGPDQIVTNLDRDMRPGSIVLFHQSLSAVAALDRVLDNVEAKGYESVPVVRLLGGKFAR